LTLELSTVVVAPSRPRRTFLAASLSALTLSLSLTMAQAADIAAQSKIDAVTVYPASAEVLRVAKVKIPRGEHAVLLTDLPAQAIPQSIRVEGKGSAAFQIGSVDNRRTNVSRGDQAQMAQERKRIEGEIEKLNDEKAQANAQVRAAQQQQVLIKNLSEMPGKPVPAGTQPAAAPDWGQLIQFIGERTLALEKVILDTQFKVRDLDRKIADLQGKLATVAPAEVQRTEVRVNVAAQNDVEAEFVIRYQVGGAAWTPVYDARLVTPAQRGAKPTLQLVRRAAIQQRTGEAWNDVAVTLSTTRPTAGTAAPDLAMSRVDFFAPPPPVVMSAPAPRAAMAPAPPPDSSTMQAGARMKADALVVAQTVESTIDNRAFQALFGIPGRVTISETGEVKRVQISTDDLEPQLVVRTVPSVDPTAYLYAKLVTPRGASPILAGQVSLFRDGTFVGNGVLPQLAPGEDHELGFGTDDKTKVKRNILEDKKGERGILTSSRVEERNFEILVKSLHAQPLQVQVIDRIPVSANEAIKVDPVFNKPEPTRRDFKDQRGVMLWEFALAPDQEQAIRFGFKVTSPTDKPIVYDGGARRF
jgi:uncharacterized protein (TIGR02231 family)